MARHLDDLATAIDVGERWGLKIASAAAYQELLNQITRQGPGAVEEAVLELGYRPRDLGAVEEWIHTGWRPWRPGRFPYRDPAHLLSTLADSRVPDQLGTAATVRRIGYQNPLEVVLTGSGFLIAGTIYLLRMVRDWSSARRASAASADEAQARAQLAMTEADILRWFAQEARAGRWHVPPGELLDLVRPSDLAALNRLGTSELELELPQPLDPDPKRS